MTDQQKAQACVDAFKPLADAAEKVLQSLVDDGGPAFPWTEMATRSDGTDYFAAQHPGMGLRDYLAAKVLPLTLAEQIRQYEWLSLDIDGTIPHHDTLTHRQRRAEQLNAAAVDAYAAADAMLAARSKS